MNTPEDVVNDAILKHRAEIEGDEKAREGRKPGISEYEALRRYPGAVVGGDLAHG